ncbi:alpha-L-rhamnosidase C-terminal domain-containing protein [Yinghuangia aomiensis]|uniref:alpha-L-rhamnosidase C-terminal domain-containing protein n=1 Tax=Yinghuangia aomiensis TaxID=676205 RepID=UPI003CD05900
MSYTHPSITTAREPSYRSAPLHRRHPDARGLPRVPPLRHRPRPGCGLTWAEAEFDSVHGRISTR